MQYITMNEFPDPDLSKDKEFEEAGLHGVVGEHDPSSRSGRKNAGRTFAEETVHEFPRLTTT